MLSKVDCNRPLGDIYEEIIELVRVRFCVCKSIGVLIFNSVSSLGSAASEKVSKTYRMMKYPRLNSATGKEGEAESLLFACSARVHDQPCSLLNSSQTDLVVLMIPTQPGESE